MGVGDEIVAAGQAQRLFEETGCRVVIVGLDGKPRWHEIWAGNPAIVDPRGVRMPEDALVLKSGPNCRPYIVYPFSADSGWTFNADFACRDYVARIYLTPAEQAIGERARKEFGPYVLIEPYSKHENFRWPHERWEALVAACQDLTFVQHTHKDSVLVKGAHQVPATFREACSLVAHADVYVRSESGMCHAAAAFGTRQVTLFGGCMDASVMGGYPNQTCLVDDGPGSPCGRYLRCDHCRTAMARITVAEVKKALRAHLRGRKAA
jgi:hypothetical protein